MLTTVGGHWELRAVALLKTVWWGMRLASLLMHLFVGYFEMFFVIMVVLLR